MDVKNNHSIKVGLSRWYLAAVLVFVLVIIGAYFWNRQRLWTLTGHDGSPVCRVEAGWTRQEVLAHCGTPSGIGAQPKVPASGSATFDLKMCSAPGDVYTTKVVLYGCDGRVAAVERMPTQGFLYPSK
jgi:hypothetical protein